MIYREWFINFRFPDHEKCKMVKSGLQVTPEGWRVRTLNEICEKIASGGTPSRKKEAFWNIGTINWFKTKELIDNFLFDSEETISEEGLTNSSAKIFPSGTIIMAIYAAPTVGRLGILTRNSSFNQAAVGFVVDKKQITTEFLFYKLIEERANFNAIAQGAAQQNINVQKVRDKEVLVPHFNLITMFSEIVKPMRDLIKDLSQKNIVLRKTLKFLLPKLISGEIDVENLDINTESVN